MTPTEAQQLADEIEAKWKEGTPGPWGSEDVEEQEYDKRTRYHGCLEVHSDSAVICYAIGTYYGRDEKAKRLNRQGYNNARNIASAPTDIARLIAALRGALEENRELRRQACELCGPDHREDPCWSEPNYDGVRVANDGCCTFCRQMIAEQDGPQ